MSAGRYKKSPRRTWVDTLATGVLVGVFGGFLIVTGMFLVVRERYTFIRNISISGNTVVSASSIQRVVRGILREDCYINISCEYGVWLPTDRVVEGIISQIPRIDKVEVIYRDDGVLGVHVSERDVSFRFCIDKNLLDCYLVDDSGVIFERAPQLSDLRYIPTVYPDTTKISVAVDGSSLPIRLWGDIEMSQFNELNKIVAMYGRIYRVEYSRRDINVEVDRLYDYLIANDTAVLKFNRESLNDGERTMYISASLDRLISFQPFASRFKVSPQSLEYLDLRFPKRLYMKFAEEESEVKEAVNQP